MAKAKKPQPSENTSAKPTVEKTVSTQAQNKPAQRPSNRNQNRRPQSREERENDRAQRTVRKIETVKALIEQNPENTRLITTELYESKRLANAIDDIENGARDVRMEMGSSRLPWDQAQVILECLNWSQNQVVNTVRIMNGRGYGTRRNTYEIREKNTTLHKQASSLATDPLSVALKERADIELSFNKKIEETMMARLEEDRKTNSEFSKQVSALDEKIATLRKEKQEADAKAKTEEKEKEKAAKKAEHEKRIKEAKEKKEKEKAAKKAAHEQRMKEQQEAAAKKRENAVNTVDSSPEKTAEEKKESKSA